VPPERSGVVEFRLGDVVTLRRSHPCGGREWLVDRIGADIGLRCRTCDRHVLIERRGVERRLTGFVQRGNLAMTRAAAPRPEAAARGASSGSPGAASPAGAEAAADPSGEA
jgi:hypothetical protein